MPPENSGSRHSRKKLLFRGKKPALHWFCCQKRYKAYKREQKKTFRKIKKFLVCCAKVEAFFFAWNEFEERSFLSPFPEKQISFTKCKATAREDLTPPPFLLIPSQTSKISAECFPLCHVNATKRGEITNLLETSVKYAFVYLNFGDFASSSRCVASDFHALNGQREKEKEGGSEDYRAIRTFARNQLA